MFEFISVNVAEVGHHLHGCVVHAHVVRRVRMWRRGLGGGTGAGRSGCHGVEPWLTVAEEAKRIQAMTISFGVPHLAGIEQNWRWVRGLCLVLAL